MKLKLNELFSCGVLLSLLLFNIYNFFGVHNLFADFYVGGEITENTTWYLNESPYIVISDVTICGAGSGQTATLIIQPGVQVRFEPNTGIYVGKPSNYLGTLIAQGTQSQPITFTSNLTSPFPGAWDAIYFRPQTNNTLTMLDYCNFEYGGNSSLYNTTLFFESTSPTVTNSIISNSGGYGIYSDDNSGPTLTSNTYLNNAFYPISTNPNSILNITQSTGSGNNPDAIEVRQGEVTVDNVWTNQDFPYELSSNVTICDYNLTETATLTINPGTRIQVRPDTSIFVGKSPNRKGAIIAQGTQSEPITFTSYNTISPSPGDWDSIYFRDQANDKLTMFDFCSFEYAGNNIAYNATLYFEESSPKISRSNILNSSGWGIYSNTTYSNPVIHNSNIIFNSLGGINHINATTNTTVQAQYNWWGDSSGPSGAGPGQGQWISDNVEYEPWLGESFSLDFYLSHISVSPQKFSQNGGWTTFGIDISESANWTITIEDDTPQLVKTLSGSGTQIRQDWYGDDENQQPLLNGIYTYTVSAESIAHPGTNASLVGGQIELDDTLPTAKITSPEFYDFLANNLLSSEFEILGTASGTNFSSYTLEYGEGEYPTQWNTITTSTNLVENGLLGTWDATGLYGSVYTIRLIVTDTSQNLATDLVTINLLAVYNLYDSIDPFSPNVDGSKDDTTIGAEFSHLSDWLLNITDSGHQTVRTFNGTNSSSLSQLWDGKDESQQTLADDNYTYQIQITEPSSSTTALSGTDTSSIDNTSPTTEISLPQPNGLISGLVTIVGTADDLHFESYKVEYGIGLEPSGWITIQPTTFTPIINDTLATWDVIDFDNGDYVIRFTVNDTAGNTATLDRPVVIDNIQITNVYTDPTSFNPSIGETVDINYTIDRDANVITVIQNLFYNIIKILGPNFRLAGPNIEIWNGFNQTGNITADGAYTFSLNVTDGTSFGEYTPDYIPDTVGVGGFSLDYGFDPHNNELCNITYNLADDAQVLIKAGGAGGDDPNWAIVNSRPRQSGPNIDYWNGRDPNNNVVDLSTGTVAIWAQKLPDEPIIVVSDLVVEVATDPYSIIPSYGEFTTITYTISKPVNVSVFVYNPQGALVKVLEDNVAKNAGTYEITWDGTDANNEPVSQQGNFTIKVEATGGDSKTTTSFANVTVH